MREYQFHDCEITCDSKKKKGEQKKSELWDVYFEFCGKMYVLMYGNKQPGHSAKWLFLFHKKKHKKL